MKYNPPTNPGVYIMKDNSDEVIYVGKAKNIKKRVSSYFHSKDHSQKTEDLVKNIDDIDFIITDNEVEALILESELIRKHKPKFNMMLKDSVRYAYIKITDEKYPRAVTARKKIKKEKLYGPYVSGTKRKMLLDISQKIFGLRSCRTLPKSVCLLYHIKRCSGPCENHISKEDYKKEVQNFEKVLKGNTNELIEELKIEMNTYSKHLNFEKAKDIRDQISALEISEYQKIDTDKEYDQDVIALIHDKNNALIILFNIKKGVISGKREYKFDMEEELMSSFLRTYYFSRKIPKEIIISHKIEDKETLQEYLSNKRGSKVIINNPQKGEKKKILEMVLKNAQYSFEKDAVSILQSDLGLDERPKIIECFDISTLGGTQNVAACIQFVDGKPNNSEYRKFIIRDVQGQDDFASMGEAVRRRYTRQLKEGNELPDLIVIDGGKGQLGMAYAELQNLHLNTPIIGLAKEFEEVYTPKRRLPIIIDHKKESLKLLQRIRDETHRFVITFQRIRRKNTFKETALDNIQGIGENTKFKLLKKFKSIDGIKKASKEKLEKIVGKKIANTIKQKLE